MVNYELVAELLFELSNISRLEILLKINKTPLKQSQIAKQLSQTIQETSRHLSRLCDAKLTQRNIDGLYTTTPLGQQITSLLPSVSFLISNAEYFSIHYPSVIPSSFTYGFGLIQEYKLAPHVMETFRQVEELIKESEKFIWIHSDQILSSSIPLLDEAMKRGVEFRVILPRDAIVQIDHLASHEEILEHKHHKVHGRFIESVELVLVMSEKGASMSFPLHEGRHDYLGFSISNQDALEWCRELFLYYWEQSTEY